MGFELVWLKRDLRWEDHAPLACAAAQGPIRVMYVVEPELWQQPDASLQHLAFIRESLQDLHAAFQQVSGAVEVFHGDILDVLTSMWRQTRFERLYSHEETGNAFTHRRDLAVAGWCREHGVVWREAPQFGVVRGLKDRDRWQKAWESHMAAARSQPGPLRFWRPYPQHELNLETPGGLEHDPPQRQRGGRRRAIAVIEDFLHRRSNSYRGGISSPLLAPNACSRLSVYIAYGCISMREVVQLTRAELRDTPGSSRRRAGLRSFLSRLYWHCHFIQKLESEPEIEWRNMHRGYDGLREADFSQERFLALQAGRTGWPMVDACVAMLRETGWLNFRMRAMLVSVAAYPLWLHWQPVGQWLARQFLDYEPGIHWSQMQMQSGTTGINTTRVYNPIKQAQDHDPEGRFVRQWLPHLRRVSDNWIFEPWQMPSHLRDPQGQGGVDDEIVPPIVDLALATREAKRRLYERRHKPEVRAGQQAVVERHASRQGWRGEARGQRRVEPDRQLTLDI
jgi:deoxyribodipyrimidine photo-lyase